MVQHFVIATAGHVDHGKSALVKALTGTDPDRLPEEKARGITIDLGFAQLALPATSTCPAMHLGIVDVPGHEDFVKNMVAGVGSIDLALLVVAADDGWMPQTEEHLQILTYLGVTRAVVALTKIDLLPSHDATADAIRERLRETPFASAPIVGTSVLHGRGLDDLREAIGSACAAAPPQLDLGKPRLPIDRVFTLRGIGIVVTGTLIGGALHRGQAVVLQPAGHGARIRTLHNHHAEVEISPPGTRTALNLPDLTAQTDADSARRGVQRGDVVTLPELALASDTADVLLARSARPIDARSAVARPLNSGKRVRIHHGSSNLPARLLMNDAELLPGGRTLAQLQFEGQLFAFAGDRFIVRDWSEQQTLAGGMILDPDASRGQFRSKAQQAYLAQRADDFTCATCLRTQLARDGAARRERILVKSSWSAAQIAETVGRLAEDGVVIVADEFVADAAWWKEQLRIAGEAIDRWHRDQPEQRGMPLQELRTSLGLDPRAVEVLDALVGKLADHGFERAGAAVRRSTHLPALPPALRAAGDKLRAVLAAKPVDPPPRKELAHDPESQQALRFLIQTGEAVELGPELVMLAENVARARELIRSLLQANGSATVSELRQAVGTNRRVIVPLVEHLDRIGLTLRQGDKRILRRP